MGEAGGLDNPDSLDWQAESAPAETGGNQARSTSRCRRLDTGEGLSDIRPIDRVIDS